MNKKVKKNLRVMLSGFTNSQGEEFIVGDWVSLVEDAYEDEFYAELGTDWEPENYFKITLIYKYCGKMSSFRKGIFVQLYQTNIPPSYHYFDIGSIIKL